MRKNRILLTMVLCYLGGGEEVKVWNGQESKESKWKAKKWLTKGKCQNKRERGRETERKRKSVTV